MKSSLSSINLTAKANAVSRSTLQILHSSITIATLGICAVYLFLFNGLLEIGHLWKSPTIPLIIASEFIKCNVNEKYLKLLARPKHLINTYQHREGMVDRLKDSFNTIITLVVSFSVFVFACIIFGAAIFQDYLGSICLSITLVTYTVLPLCLYLGGTGTWQLLFCDQFELTSKLQIAYLDYTQINAMAALFGAWISSVVHPLDWDRDWQNYPIPNMCGAMLGIALANVYWLMTGVGKHFVKNGRYMKRQKSS